VPLDLLGEGAAVNARAQFRIDGHVQVCARGEQDESGVVHPGEVIYRLWFYV
jgi:hypothetical protein